MSQLEWAAAYRKPFKLSVYLEGVTHQSTVHLPNVTKITQYHK